MISLLLAHSTCGTLLHYVRYTILFCLPTFRFATFVYIYVQYGTLPTFTLYMTVPRLGTFFIVTPHTFSTHHHYACGFTPLHPHSPHTYTFTTHGIYYYYVTHTCRTLRVWLLHTLRFTRVYTTPVPLHVTHTFIHTLCRYRSPPTYPRFATHTPVADSFVRVVAVWVRTCRLRWIRIRWLLDAAGLVRLLPLPSFTVCVVLYDFVTRLVHAFGSFWIGYTYVTDSCSRCLNRYHGALHLRDLHVTV